ncbi:MAG TPA: hypothetical protein VGK67_11320 [Myxococcales bacterium]
MRGLVMTLVFLLSAPALAGEMVPLVSEGKLAELCSALQPAERQVFTGSATAKSQAKASFEKEHDRLKKTVFLLELTWGGFTVGEWDEAEKTVTLATEKPFRAFNGALALFDAGREDIELEAVESEIEALKAGLAKGTLSLALMFKPAEEEGAPCVVSKAKSYAFSIDLVGAELRANGKAVARSTKDDLQPLPTAHGKPTVEIRSASQDCGECKPEVVDGVGKTLPELSKCYEAALAKKGTLDGSYVFTVSSGKQGELKVGLVIADSVDNPELLACAKAAIATGSSSIKGGLAQVLVEFSRK